MLLLHRSAIWHAAIPEHTLSCPGRCCRCRRWSVLRINEGNTQTLMSVLNLLKVVLDLLAQSGYKMSEYEGKLLLPGGRGWTRW